MTVEIRQGSVLDSRAQTLVNTVNCAGVMGKGVALAFKKRFPEMYEDYADRCARGEVEIGRPYLYMRPGGPNIVNFPTKKHWRQRSRMEYIDRGLEYLQGHYREWGVTSLAVPALGCGNGGLDWSEVGPMLEQHFADYDIPVALFEPSPSTSAESRSIGVSAEEDSPVVQLPLIGDE